jgi:ABC-2 type transport system ATP-binding protein
MTAIEVSSLTVRYGDVVAVDRLSFTAEAGRVTCVLGRNGAGKTSTIECLEGLRAPTSGHVSVIGLDPRDDHRALVPRIGVMLQEGGVYPAARPLEVLHHAAALYRRPIAPGTLVDRLGLGGLERRTWRQLSGGEQRRLTLALALVGRPQVAFLDEPTAGVDPAGRQTIREVIGDLRANGVTVLMTTHDLDEAERIADDIVIIDGSRLVARGTLAELVRPTDKGDRVRFSAPVGIDVGSLAGYIRAPVVQTTPGHYEVGAVPQPTTVAAITAWLAEKDIPLDELHASRQRLEDVFLRLTSTAVASARRPPIPPPPPSVPLSVPVPVSPPPAPVPLRASGGVGARARTSVPDGRPLLAQLRLDVTLTLRNGESLLLTLGLPVTILVFFSLVDVLPADGEAVDFLVPGMLSLAVLATAFTNLAITTGFDRSYGVLKRLGATPLGRHRLITAKALAVLAVIALQVMALGVSGLALGWRPAIEPVALAFAVVLGVVAFTGLALTVAGRLRALVALAAANALFLGALLLSGMVFPLDELPGPLRVTVRALPSTALAEAVRGALTEGLGVPAQVWPVLVVWAIAGVWLAVNLFRWEPSD